jgi:hypothetical protein
MKKLIAVMLVTGIFIGVTGAYGQTGQLARSPNARMDPCPGGSATISTIDTIAGPRRLEDLIQLSQLILVGTVVEVLPATRTDPNHLNLIQTTSLLSVNELLMGTLAPGTKTISMSQLGGRVDPCTLHVPEDPLVSVGEDYVLFLLEDKRTDPPNTTGSPRYTPIGVWSGKAKIRLARFNFSHVSAKHFTSTTTLMQQCS